MKIYTKTGDDGTTGLIGGQRVSKTDARMDCCGTVDELNATIGVAAVVADPALLGKLRAIQNELFVIGSAIAAKDATTALPQLKEQSITRLETEIDAATAQLPPLQNFILPGGSEISARLHVARTVCRRAERVVVAHLQEDSRMGMMVRYLNRLSDWLFTQARAENARAGVRDIEWEK